MHKIIILVLLCNSLLVSGQSGKFILNKVVFSKNVKYQIVLQSCDTCMPIKNVGFRAKTNINNKDIILLKKVEKDVWLHYLKQSKYDFILNIILYELYSKDASKFISCNDVKQWRLYFKSEDLEFWGAKLSP